MFSVSTEAALDEFLAKVKESDLSLLLLDYDGTLAPFTINRDLAVPYPGVRTLLQKIIETCRTRVVFISGRPCSEVARLLDIPNPVEIWGMHGWQHLKMDGSCTRYVMEDGDRGALANANAWMRELGYAHLAERKQSGIALHWRGLPDTDIATIRETVGATELPSRCVQRMIIREFNGGIELQLKSRTKASVVRTLVEQTSSSSPIAYLGDDQTDEDAFRALADRGFRILVRSEWPESEADLLLRPPEELLDFFLRWLLACGGIR